MIYKTWNNFCVFEKRKKFENFKKVKKEKKKKKNENRMKSIQFGWSDSSSISSSSTWWKKKINNVEKSDEEIKCYKEKEINLNN